MHVGINDIAGWYIAWTKDKKIFTASPAILHRLQGLELLSIFQYY